MKITKKLAKIQKPNLFGLGPKFDDYHSLGVLQEEEDYLLCLKALCTGHVRAGDFPPIFRSFVQASTLQNLKCFSLAYFETGQSL